MSINDYNLDEQIALIDLAESMIQLIDRYGPSETFVDRGHDTDDFFSIYISIEKKVLKIKPDLFDEDEDEG